jgi:uncharacterized protein (TIGR03435 family)
MAFQTLPAWWLALTIAGGGVAAAVAQQTAPVFEVASIRRTDKPLVPNPGFQVQPGGRLVGRHVTALDLIQFASELRRVQIVGGPDWIDKVRFDLTARAETQVPERQIREMVQSLLRDRFRLIVGREQRQMPVYELVVDRNDKRLGPSLIQMADEKDCDAERERLLKQSTSAPIRAGMVLRECGSLDMLVRFAVAYVKDGVVLDRTGLTGTWSFYTQFSFGPDTSLPSFFTAIREQLGLRLERGRGLVDVLIVQSIQQPTDN